MNIILYPRVSEKAYAGATSDNIYVFNIPISSNKLEIKKSIEALYSVKVEVVNIVRVKGKVKRTVKKGGRSVNGKRSDFKKAYVKVTEGQTIPVFAAEEEGDK
jgi:large subunit ribosomal protein L23